MTTTTTPAPPSGSRNGVGRRLSRSSSPRLLAPSRLRLGGLLVGRPSCGWSLIYLGSLGALLLTSLYTTDDSTGAVVKTVRRSTNFQDLLYEPSVPRR